MNGGTSPLDPNYEITRTKGTGSFQINVHESLKNGLDLLFSYLFSDIIFALIGFGRVATRVVLGSDSVRAE